MPPDERRATERLTDVITDWQLDGTDSWDYPEAECLHLVCLSSAAERMRQGGLQALILPLVKFAVLECVFIGVVTAAVGQLTFAFATAARSTFIS